jgi:hypothetical protein
MKLNDPTTNLAGAHGHAPLQYQVDLLGLDVFGPVTMDTLHRTGDDVPAWFLDTNYNSLSFHGRLPTNASAVWLGLLNPRLSAAVNLIQGFPLPGTCVVKRFKRNS